MRFLVEDDVAQAATARRMVASPCLVTATVLMEVEWVLRGFYRWPRDAIAASLSDVVDLPTMVVHPPAISWAISRYAQGADFADMVHLVMAEGAAQFVTFDRSIVGDAGSDSPIPIETLA